MAAGLGFKDFTTGEVLTAADVDGYLMQGIWVFANAAARDAAVTSPQEGNACYLKDTDVIQVYTGSAWAAQSASNPISANIVDAKGDIIAATAADTVARLAVGANDTVLTADSSTATGLKWATPASGGGMTLLSTTTLSGNSTVTLSSISGSYTDLRLVYLGVYGNASSADMNMQLRLNGDTGSNYESSYFRSWSTGPYVNDTGATRIIIGKNNNSSTAANQINGILTLPRYTETSGSQLVTGTGWGGFNVVGQMVNGLYTGRSAAITSITIFIEGGGTQFSGGTVYLYGVK